MRRVLLAVAVLFAACSSGGNDAPSPSHGRLLSSRVLPGLVANATTYRIRYTSVSVAGKPIEVTGVAVVPNAAAPRGGRVVLTSAHGTTGIADVCAPSRQARPPEVAAIGAGAVANGWLLAATDYEGLGTPGRHPYLVGVSEGRSVLDAALAAAELPNAHASRRLLIAGYSQGGHAAAWANQIAPRWTPSLRVLGASVGAPATEIDRILAAGRTTPIQPFIVSIVAGYAAAYPKADPARYLTPAGVAGLASVDRGCLDDVRAAMRAIPPDELVRRSGPTDPQWLALGRRNNPGAVRGGGPVLIVHSDQDDVVPVELSRLMHDRMCAHGQVVERRVIHAGGHTQAVVAAYFAAVTWMQQRVDGVRATNDCAANSNDG